MNATIREVVARRANPLEWIAAAKAERRAYRAWQQALPLAPIQRGPDRYGQPWFGYVDRLRAEHAAASAALGVASARAARGVSIDSVDKYGWQHIRVGGIASGASVQITPSGNVLLSTPKHERTTHRNVEAALNSWPFVGMLLDFNA